MPRHDLHQAPVDCPVCGNDMIITRKGCLNCGTELAGEFSSCEFCALDAAETDLLRVFLASRGNLREVEKHLGVSYPTARSRLTAVLAKLGLADGDEATSERVGEAEPGDDDGSSDHEPSGVSERDQILAAVAEGSLSAGDAAALLNR